MSVAHASTQTPTTLPRGSAPRLAAVSLATAVTLSAFLLFQVQPLAAKYVLPWYGGGAGVWTTCMVFFQVALLVGYLYAHLSVTFLRPRRQAALHAILVAAALMMLPIIPAERWKPIDPTADPSWRILLLLLATLGAPYVVLSATAPLMQAWFARLFPGRSPYRLYALSNAASLAALLSFPFAFEPLLSRKGQAYAWSAGYVLLAACLAACIAFVWKGAAAEATAPSSPAGSKDAIDTTATATATRTPLVYYLLWLLLPACASLMFLAVTNKLCLDVAPVPFLWILPVSLYLITFILCFDSDRWYRRWFWGPFLVVALGGVGYALRHDATLEAATKVGLLCLALFACCMVCHGELAALKPGPRRLTAFYLMIAVGGAAGGAFVGIVAPVIFDQFLELHIGLALTWLLFLAALAANPASPLYAFRRPGWWYALIIAGVLLVTGLYAHVSLRYGGATILSRVRNFHGVILAYEPHHGAPRVEMDHNGVRHGLQYLDHNRRMETTTYYHRGSGVGRLLTAYEGRPARIGVVGLGAGTLAGAATAGQVMRFYELDPDVERLAREHFTFISGSPAKVEVILGDARLTMEREPPQAYDVLAVDAFSGDAIPVHLLTREAIDVYLRHLKPNGVLALHLSNWHFDLSPVVAGLARERDLHLVFVGQPDGIFWALLSRDPASLDPVRPFVSPQSMPSSTRIWTDDYASVFPLLKWR